MKFSMNLLRLTVFSICMLIGIQARADFVNPIRADRCETIIEMFIEDGQVRVTLEIGLNDLEHFKEVIPLDYLKEGYQNVRNESVFFSEIFVVKADERILKGQILQQEIIPRKYRASLITGKVDTNFNLSPEVLFTEIVYSLAYQPGTISFTPPIPKGYEVSLANIGFITYHKSIPVNDLRYLGIEEKLNLNWEDPWYSRFENRNLRRHHQSSLLSFLYLDPYEVRHEVLVRVMDMKNWMDLDYELGDFIEVAEQASLKNEIAQFLLQHNKVTIDGLEKIPIIDKVHFVKWSLAGIQILDQPERMDFSTAVIGVIFAWPHDSLAREATIHWDLFSEKITEVPNVATDPAGPMPYILKPDDNLLTWTNYLKNYRLPTISNVAVRGPKVNSLKLLGLIMAIAGVGLIIYKVSRKRKPAYAFIILLLVGGILIMSGFFIDAKIDLPFGGKSYIAEPDAEDLISQLLHNTYRAFDFREESDVYDKLAVSYAGDMLSEVYLQTKQSMILENQGGIQVKVKEVDILEVEKVKTDQEGLAYRCIWQVKGDVGHWGHIHRRTNQYAAILNMRPVKGIWKLFDIDLIEEVRL